MPLSIRINRAHWPVTVLGYGHRIGIWVQGCSIQCPGCCSRDTWDVNAGFSINISALVNWCRNASAGSPDGITITGGEPFDQSEALQTLIEQLDRWRQESGLAMDILCYSGYPESTLLSRWPGVVGLTDALACEPYVHTLEPLPLRGSSNQTLRLNTEIARQRYADSALPTAKRLQMIVIDGSAYLIGIPNKGDLGRIERQCAERGLVLGRPSWRAPLTRQLFGPAERDQMLSKKQGVREQQVLRAMRELAIERVRTAIPNFGETDLDRWVMETGYPAAEKPHERTADLFYVYAASLVNTSGRKPSINEFGALVRAAVGDYIRGNAVVSEFTSQDLARSCLPHLAELSLGTNYDEDIRELARGNGARRVLSGLMRSVAVFGAYLRQQHGGKASQLHAAWTAPAPDNRREAVFDVLRQLDKLPWVGIATAANFVKDSQIPGCRDQYDPRSVAQLLAGWFAKPDVHIIRLLVYLTGLCSRDELPDLEPHEGLGRFKSMVKDRGITRPSGYHAPELLVLAQAHAWAQAANTSPLEIDRVLYLIGVRQTCVQGKSITANFDSRFTRCVDALVGA